MRLLDAISARQKSSGVTNRARSLFRYGGNEYFSGSMEGSDPNVADGSFESMVRRVHNENGPVSSAVTARALLMSQVEFAWRDEKPGTALAQTPALDQLEFPEAMTRSHLLFRLEQDASYTGNAFLARRRGTRSVFRLDPSRVTFAFGSNSDLEWNSQGDLTLPFDAKVAAIVYNSSTGPGRPDHGDLEMFLPGEFAHWKPEPDPLHWWRGASWITSLLKDTVGLDGQISDHQSKFFQHAATPNLVFLMNPQLNADKVREYRDIINAEHAGTQNHWKNMFLGGATDVKVVGQDLSKLSLKDLQGGLETRIAMRSRVPAVILGAREGLSGSSLNTGNYSAARRLFADGWFSPTVKGLCEALESMVPPPAGKRLAHDPSKILFLQEDRKDEAEIDSAKVQAIRTLVDGGFDPESAVKTIAPEWAGKLDHAGLLSVQLQEPGSTGAAAGPENGAGASLGSGFVSNTAGSRTVMGRLGRATDPAAVDVDELLAGVDADIADVARRVLSTSAATDIVALRAEMLAALTTGVTA